MTRPDQTLHVLFTRHQKLLDTEEAREQKRLRVQVSPLAIPVPDAERDASAPSVVATNEASAPSKPSAQATALEPAPDGGEGTGSESEPAATAMAVDQVRAARAHEAPCQLRAAWLLERYCKPSDC